VKVLHWGAAKKPSIFPSPERLVELGAQQIVPSEGQCLVLTGQATVVSLSSQAAGEFTETVSRISKYWYSYVVYIKFGQFQDVDYEILAINNIFFCTAYLFPW
jgi:hypothetical protein